VPFCDTGSVGRAARQDKGNFCPLCRGLYRDDSTEPMVQCDGCECWIHTQCDGLGDDDYAAIGQDGQVRLRTHPACIIHIHTYIHTYMYTYTHTHTHVHPHSRTRTYTHTHTHTCTSPFTHTHIHTHTCALSLCLFFFVCDGAEMLRHVRRRGVQQYFCPTCREGRHIDPLALSAGTPSACMRFMAPCVSDSSKLLSLSVCMCVRVCVGGVGYGRGCADRGRRA
jgi:hypothetical protein